MSTRIETRYNQGLLCPCSADEGFSQERDREVQLLRILSRTRSRSQLLKDYLKNVIEMFPACDQVTDLNEAAELE
jgi:hypothetical protein